MKTSTNPTPLVARLVLALALATGAAGCTHEYQITPTYRPKLVRLPARPVCARGESLAVSVANGPGQSRDAGSVHAGIHTFNHQFTRDPATAFADGLTAALREGQCATASPGTAALSVVIGTMKAHGEACGLVSCEGVASTRVTIQVQDATGRVLLQQEVASDMKADCGMVFCSEEETSELSSHALSDTVGKTVVAIADALAKRTAAGSPAVTPGS